MAMKLQEPESSDNEAASDTSDDDIEITNISDSDEDAK